VISNPGVALMQFETDITSDDLKVILTDLIGGPFLLSFKRRNTEELIEDVNVLEFDPQTGVVVVSSTAKIDRFSYLDIERLKFRSFYGYGSLSARNFNVE
jgi:hypothetical protein